ncbi:MAG: metallo-beta-lactamase family protein [Proteobacteria bacterium]|nr:metallo-beta-lactamase family protein [Pseudomonadota bacterium]
MQSLAPDRGELLFLPLGGTGEIGMNLTLYGHDGAWIVVDLGITFGGDDFPQHPILMADPAFVAARRQRLAGILLTHGHEDHIGALPYLWQRLRCPIYATPFTAALARSKLARAGVDDAPVTEVALGGRIAVGPFTVEFITLTHSIPEPNALLIQTPVGSVLHTGDWKLDDRPIVGRGYDYLRLHALRREPLLAMVCDSTNAMVPGRTGSEADLFAPLLELGKQAKARIVVTAFASNVARLVTLARVAKALGRRFGMHRDLLLDPRDMVIFSSRVIPGNERSIQRLQQQLRMRGVQLVTDRDAFIHVSGHPAQEDLRKLFNWVQPPVMIPVHGTPRHLIANAEVAKACHVPKVCIVRNGDLCRLSRWGVDRLGQAETGRLTRQPDGRLAPVSDDLLQEMRARAN